MRTCIGGNFSDTTAALKAFLAAQNQLAVANLICIGETEYPDCILLTDWPSPLEWPPIGTFQPSVVTLGNMQTKVGLEVVNMAMDWTPKNRTFVNSSNPSAQTSPLQLAQYGYYDNWRVRIWRTVMPTPGDANTFGAMEWFGGRVADISIDRGKISFTLNSFLDIINQSIPANVIDNTNIRSGYLGANPPIGDPSIPIFNVIAGSGTTVLILDVISPNPHRIYGGNIMSHGYISFESGGSQTLGGFWSAVLENVGVIIGGTAYNQVQLYSALPWAPTPGVDKCYFSLMPPVDFSDGGSYGGFPYVPSPESAV